MAIRNDAHRDEFHRDQQWHKPVRVATTGTITISTGLNAGDTIDGVTLAAGDRVLVKDQSTGSQNGIYIAGASPARAYDMLVGVQAWGAFVYVIAGTANAGKLFKNTNTTLPTIETTALTFTEFSGGSALTVKDEGSTLTAAATSIDFVGAGVVATNSGSDVTVTIAGGGGGGGGGASLYSARVIRTNVGSDRTINSTTWADIDGTNLSLTGTTGARRCLVVFSGRISNAGGNALTRFGLTIDGTAVNTEAAGSNSIVSYRTDPASSSVGVMMVYVTDVLSAASHTFKPRWNVSTSTTTLHQSGTTDFVTFAVHEIADAVPSNGAFDIERRTAGDLSVTSTTLGAAIPTLGNNIVAAASGDLLLIGVSTQADNGSGGRLRMDVGTIVSSAVVNYVSSLSGTATTAGISGWGAEATTFTRIGPSIVYVVQSGDISGGNVELSLRAWNASAGTRVVSASSTTPLVFWVKNLKQ